jgi:hypothetical protein
MAWLSLVLGVVGLFATGAVVPYLNRWVSNWRPQHHWFLGLSRLVDCLPGVAAIVRRI